MDSRLIEFVTENQSEVSGWKGDIKDDSLARLSELLEGIGPVHDVRRVFWSKSI